MHINKYKQNTPIIIYRAGEYSYIVFHNDTYVKRQGLLVGIQSTQWFEFDSVVGDLYKFGVTQFV